MTIFDVLYYKELILFLIFIFQLTPLFLMIQHTFTFDFLFFHTNNSTYIEKKFKEKNISKSMY